MVGVNHGVDGNGDKSPRILVADRQHNCPPRIMPELCYNSTTTSVLDKTSTTTITAQLASFCPWQWVKSPPNLGQLAIPNLRTSSYFLDSYTGGGTQQFCICLWNKFFTISAHTTVTVPWLTMNFQRRYHTRQFDNSCHRTEANPCQVVCRSRELYDLQDWRLLLSGSTADHPCAAV